MLTPDQLAAIRAYAIQCLPHDIVSYKHYDVLIVELERLTRHNQRMAAALAQLSDKDNWVYLIPNHIYQWIPTIDPVSLAERALVEDI